METKKEVKKPVATKPVVVSTNRDVRTENADKTEKFFREVLKVDEVEMRKIMSRLYTKLSEKLKPKVAK